MIVNAPPVLNGGPSRALILKRWYKIIIQVLGPNTVTIGTSKAEAGQLDNGAGISDGLQFNNVNALIPVQIWWKGELWVSGSGAGCTFLLIVPGLAPSVFEAGGDQCDDVSEMLAS
jgi:hypothetical protein